MLKYHLSCFVQNVLFAPQIWSWPCFSGWVIMHVPRAGRSSSCLCTPSCPAWFVRRCTQDKGQDPGLQQKQVGLKTHTLSERPRIGVSLGVWPQARGSQVVELAGEGCVSPCPILFVSWVYCAGGWITKASKTRRCISRWVGLADPRADHRPSVGWVPCLAGQRVLWEP